MFGGQNKITSVEVVCTFCELVEELCPEKPAGIANCQDFLALSEITPSGSTFATPLLLARLNWSSFRSPKKRLRVDCTKNLARVSRKTDWWQRVLDCDYRLDPTG